MDALIEDRKRAASSDLSIASCASKALLESACFNIAAWYVVRRDFHDVTPDKHSMSMKAPTAIYYSTGGHILSYTTRSPIPRPRHPFLVSTKCTLCSAFRGCANPIGSHLRRFVLRWLSPTNYLLAWTLLPIICWITRTLMVMLGANDDGSVIARHRRKPKSM